MTGVKRGFLEYIYMKNKALTIIIVSLATLLAAFSAAAQSQHKKTPDFRSRLKSEKIAFITEALSLSPEEAQQFWPVYNQIEKESEQCFKTVVRTYRELCKAVEEEKTEKDLEAALDNYTKALDASKVDEKAKRARYEKVLSVEKVARLYVAEEKFRKMQVHRIRDHAKHKAHFKKSTQTPKNRGE